MVGRLPARRGAAGRDGDLLANIKGGVPLRFDGMLLSGLGIAGGAPDHDAEVARGVGADPVD